jgi:hypothetical protein
VRPFALLFTSVAAGLAVCTALVACSDGATAPSGDEPAAVEGNFSLEQAREFADFPLYAPAD